MKIYCSCCDKVQPVHIDNCRDAKTNEPFQDIVCAECDLVIATGTGITPPQRTWVSLTDEDIRQCSRDVVAGGPENSVDRFAYAIEAKLKEKNT
jgi:hypothetical protein